MSCRYLQEVSNRLFSEGLHAFGREPSPDGLFKYLQAYLEGREVPDSVSRLICDTELSQLDQLANKMSQQYGDELQHGGAVDDKHGAPCMHKPLANWCYNLAYSNWATCETYLLAPVHRVMLLVPVSS